MFSNNEYAELESELKACEKAHQALIERNANLEAEVARLRESRVAQLREIERLEQRVAELERAFKQEEQDCIDESEAHEKTKTALSSARKLLARCTFGQFRDAHMLDDLEHWLRANPEPATPAAEAKAGAEPTGAVELMRIERELARAEKERET